MDCLEGKVCNIHYDEEDHKPRQAPCGHEFCTACIKELIKDGIYYCPTCRKKVKVSDPDDLPVNFGLIDVIRAFKTNNISLSHITESSTAGATNDEICKVHHEAIEHRCLKCQTWLCYECIDFHSKHTGCETISSFTAMQGMRKEHIESTDMLLTAFEANTNSLSSKIQEHADKRKELLEKAEKHSEEIKKIQLMVEQGKIQKENLVKSKDNLNTANSPYALMDKIEVLTQRKQSLHSWTVKNIDTDTDLQKAIIKEKDIAVDRVYTGEKIRGKLPDETSKGTLDNRMIQVPAMSSNPPYVMCVEPESHNFFYEIQTLLVGNVKNYIQEKDKDKDFRFEDNILYPLLDRQKHQIRSFAESKSKEPFHSPGILDFGVYLLCNGVPMDPLVNIYACEVVWQVCTNANQTTPLIDKLKKEVSQLFIAQKELYTRTDIKEEYNNWLKSYRSFLKCAWILVYCRQQFEKNNLYRALPLILKACSIHESLTNSHLQGPRKTLDGNVLWKFRRTCLLTFNEELYNSYKMGDGQETVSELSSLIVPAMAQISTSNNNKDEITIAMVRNKWCQLSDEDFRSPTKSQISKQILKIMLLDLYDVKCVNLPTNVPRRNVLALYRQYIDMCQEVYGLNTL